MPEMRQKRSFQAMRNADIRWPKALPHADDTAGQEFCRGFGGTAQMADAHDVLQSDRAITVEAPVGDHATSVSCERCG